MGIQNLSEDVLLVTLPLKEPQITNELKKLNEFVSDRSNYNVIIDFSRVEVINSSSISNLLILRRLLQERERKLILSNVAIVTKCILMVADIDKLFTFADAPSTALETMQHTN